MPAIEVVFCANGGDYARLGIELLKEMKASQAAEALAWLAAYSPYQPVQKAATAALKDQRPYNYVPLLLAAMRTPIQSSFSLYNTADGSFSCGGALYENGPEQRELAIFDRQYQSVLHPTKTILFPGERYVNKAVVPSTRSVGGAGQETTAGGHDRSARREHGPGPPTTGDHRRP